MLTAAGQETPYIAQFLRKELFARRVTKGVPALEKYCRKKHIIGKSFHCLNLCSTSLQMFY